MKLLSVVTLLAVGVLAAPADSNKTNDNDQVCPGAFFSNPQCCTTDWMHLFDWDCEEPPHSFSDAVDFSAHCGLAQKEARCCIPNTGHKVYVCHKPPGSPSS